MFPIKADADFYINDGRHQPGCPEIAIDTNCDHQELISSERLFLRQDQGALGYKDFKICKLKYNFDTFIYFLKSA